MSMSTQHSLLRIRPPRVKITYDVETGDAVEQKELPFVVGILADLAGKSTNLPALKERPFVEIDRDNFNSVMQSIAPSISLHVKDMLSNEEGKTLALSLRFLTIDDFNPGNVANQINETSTLLEDRIALVDLSAKLDGNAELESVLHDVIANESTRSKLSAEAGQENSSSLRQLLTDANALKSEEDMPKWQKLFASLSKHLASEAALPVNDPYSFLMKLIGKIDKKLSLQMDEVMHHPDMQKLEAAWLGLHFMVQNTETSTTLKLRLLCITRKELQDDIEKAVEFDQSLLFKKVYENEYGTLGGTPFSCLVGDFAFGRHPQDVLLAKGIASVAAAAHAPFLAALHPSMLDMDSFSSLPAPRDLAKLFESSELVAWNSFRKSEDARYFALMLPRTLMRLPYGASTKPIDAFAYEESVDGQKNDKFCWGNPAYAMAQRIVTAYSLYGWTAAIRGAEGGGKVEQLPAYTFKTSNGDAVLKCPTEVAITDRREKELSDLGLIALCHAKGTDYAVFFGGQTVQKAKIYNLDAANANSSISARLPYILNSSRFAHYIKIMMRDKIGSFTDKDDIERYLQNWIAEYVLLSDEGSAELKSKLPLREAQITVVDVPGAPGSYKAVMFLRPHFQLEELSVSMRLVSSLPKQA